MNNENEFHGGAMADKELREKKDAEWDRQEPAMGELLAGGAQYFLDRRGDTGVFSDKRERVCCMDEGTANLDSKGSLCMAGSGILYPAQSWEERIKRVVEICHRLGVRQITSHDGCGAAGLAFKRDGGAAKLGDITPDEYGQKWARELQAALDKRLGRRESASVNISAGEMKRPPEFHNARVVWFDATGRFNPAKLGDAIPRGFVIDYGHAVELARTREEADYPLAELAVAINIALGEYGFGKKFTADRPLVIVVLARNPGELETVKEWIARGLPADKKELVRVDGFVRR